AASFRFHLAMDTLAVRLAVPRDGSAEDLHLQVRAPCRAHGEDAAASELPAAAEILLKSDAGERFLDTWSLGTD
ncbi:MAG: hypothetical protein LBQ10_02605, partial [Desulfovibrio sp.]|nr:hypothetical protein [Desulfovibrio sp.]